MSKASVLTMSEFADSFEETLPFAPWQKRRTVVKDDARPRAHAVMDEVAKIHGSSDWTYRAAAQMAKALTVPHMPVNVAADALTPTDKRELKQWFIEFPKSDEYAYEAIKEGGRAGNPALLVAAYRKALEDIGGTLLLLISFGNAFNVEFGK